MSTGNNPQSFFEEKSASFCCAFFPEMACSNPGFSSWLDALPLLDRKSLLLDVELLQKLSQSILVDAKDLHGVSRSKVQTYIYVFSLKKKKILAISVVCFYKQLLRLRLTQSVRGNSLNRRERKKKKKIHLHIFWDLISWDGCNEPTLGPHVAMTIMVEVELRRHHQRFLRLPKSEFCDEK